jgi:hypothetical protein
MVIPKIANLFEYRGRSCHFLHDAGENQFCCYPYA